VRGVQADRTGAARPRAILGGPPDFARGPVAASCRAARSIAAAAAVAVVFAAVACRRGEPPRLLLLLTVDTLRADRLGAYGSPLGLTPHLDGLLAESQLFRAAYAPASYTLPSLGALLTGRHPEELGVTANVSRIDPGRFATLASVLRLHGWRTGAVVSNWVVREGTGAEAGFELFDDTFPQREANRDVPERIAEDTVDAALATLDHLLDGGARDVLLWVHFQDPHGPYLPPPGYRERYLEAERREPDGRRELPVRGAPGDGTAGPDSIPVYQYVAGEHEVAFYRAGYDGEVAYLDEQVGRLLAGLAERRLRDGALIVFSADHGEALGGGYWFAHGERLTDPLVRVPFGIRVPGMPPRERSDPAALVDVLPTALGLVGIEAPPGYPGRDLFAADAERARPEIYLSTLLGGPKLHVGLVVDGFKYELRSGEEPGEVLYRIGDEERDLSSEEPARLAELRERLLRVRAGLVAGRELRQEIGPEERARLRALGYAED
jgi:arylsulfatase